jgi:hypothetical protein
MDRLHHGTDRNFALRPRPTNSSDKIEENPENAVNAISRLIVFRVIASFRYRDVVP